MSGQDIKKIAVIIPCYNEADGIANVIKKFPHDRITRNLFDIQIYVIDNNSTDGTAQVARDAGAIVIHEPKKGKGNALRTGFRSIPADTDYVVMLDGDDTYDPSEVLRLVDLLHADFCDVVIGSRLSGKMTGASMTRFNRFGNWLFTHLVRYAYNGANVTDVLTGYFAWKKQIIDELHPHLNSPGFAIEMEMITKMARLGHEIFSVPISYHERAGHTNLHPVKDGIRIMKMFVRNLTWSPSRVKLSPLSQREDDLV